MKPVLKLLSTNLILVSLGVGVLAFSLLAAQATVLVSIPFNYTGTLPQSLQNFNSTNPNFTGASGITGNFKNAAGAGTLSAGSANSYTNSDGGAITGGVSGLSLQYSASDYTSVAYASALSGQTLFVGFLYRQTTTGGRVIIALGNSGTVNSPNTASVPRFDLDGASMTCDVKGGSGNSPSAATMVANTTNLVVGRLNWDGSKYSSMDIWVNPPYNGGAPNEATKQTSTGGTVTTLSSPVFRLSLLATVGGGGSPTANISRFVIGTNWTDVVPYGGLVTNSPPVTYYVATNGNNANSGTNLASPFQTISKAASVMKAGDTCLIRKGIYREGVLVTNSGSSLAPITFAPYAGESVIVSGADVISPSWSVHTNSIYKAATGLTFRQLFVDGAMMNEARWPNAPTDKFLDAPRARVTTGNANNTFLVDTALPNLNLVGATLHLFPGQPEGEWSAFTRVVTNYDQAAKKIIWANGGWSSGGDGVSYAVTAGNPYYLYGALSLLDQPTEWYLDSTAGTLYLWTPDGASPAAHSVEVKARGSAFVLDNCSYITLSNLYVFAAGIHMTNSTGCVVDNCHLRYVQHDTTASWVSYTDTGIDAACAVSGSGNVWKNSSILFSSQDGLRLGSGNVLVTNCVISEVDYYPGGYYASVNPVSGNGNHKLVGSTLSGSGRFLVWLNGGIEVAYNDMIRAERLQGDGGAMYAFFRDLTGTKIHHNWVHDSEQGIYLDNGTHDCVVYRNVCFDNINGMHLNIPGYNHLIYNNTLFRNPVGMPVPSSGIPNSQAGTQVINTLSDGGLSFAPDCTTNQNGWFPPVGTNFVPQPGSGAIDAGQLIPGYTDGYVGSAPDIGAYETGGAYWTPGATFSIPPFPTPGSTSVPPAPTGVTATPLTEAIALSLSWVASPTAVSYYNVKRSTSSGGPYTNIGVVLAGTVFEDTNVLVNQTYYYVVSAVNSTGEGTNSAAGSGSPNAIVVVDNFDLTGVSAIGTWNVSTTSGAYRGSMWYYFSGSSGHSVTYTPNLPVGGAYQVFMQWSQNANRANNTPVAVNYSGGSSNLTLNQQTNGGKWNLLGTFNFGAGTNGNVVVRDNGANGVVVADAVKFVQVPSATPINFIGAKYSGGIVSLMATGAINAPYRLWGTSNLASPLNNWTVLVSNTVTASPFTNTDLTATNYPQRFYRFSNP